MLDNNMIKAIRLVNGYNSDLKIKLKRVNKDSLWDWIDENRFGIFGIDFGASKPSPESEEWDKYEAAIRSAVRQVVEGR